MVRRINLTCCNTHLSDTISSTEPLQLDFFADTETQSLEQKREQQRQDTILNIRKKYGKNAILKGMNLQEGATTIERNNQIGGHKA